MKDDYIFKENEGISNEAWLYKRRRKWEVNRPKEENSGAGFV
jgi:hypothetical protein